MGLFFQRRQVWKTTWKLRLGILLLLAVVFFSTRTRCLTSLGRSLVHDETPSRSDAVILENYDQDYLVFETAARLLKAGLSDRLLVPVSVDSNTNVPNDVALGFAEVMLRVARIDGAEIIPVKHQEPITLGVARQVADRLRDEDVRSVTVVSPTFRSRRSCEVYSSVLEPMGISVSCVAVRSSRTPENWWRTTHGIQMVFLEFIKLHYYRIAVL